MDKKSKCMLNIASIMSLSAMFNEKLASSIETGESYPKLVEVCTDISLGKAILEKVATDLVELKNTQYKERNEIVNPNYIQGAIEQVDNLYSIASTIYQTKLEKLANDMQKEAGVVSGAILGSMVGAGIGGGNSIDKSKEQNPNAEFSDYEGNFAGGALKGAAIGTVAGGALGKVKDVAKNIAAKVIKKAEEEVEQKQATMDVPTEEEKKKENNRASKEDEESTIVNVENEDTKSGDYKKDKMKEQRSRVEDENEDLNNN
jgi:outer membrane lipoprotein SlyB